MKKLLDHSAAPLASLLLGVVWWQSERSHILFDVVPVRADTFTTSPYAAFVFVGFLVALATCRARPTWALSLAGLLLVTQLLFWPARFSQTSWTGYFVLIPLVVVASRYVPDQYRRRSLVGVLLAAAAVAALLSVPNLSMSGAEGTIYGKPWSIQPAVTQNISVWLVVCVAVAYGSWRIGRRRTEALIPAAALDSAMPTGSSEQLSTLSPREREIFMLVARGRSNADVASSLFISEVTVKTHVGSLLRKLGLRSRSELIAYAYDHNILRPAYGQ